MPVLDMDEEVKRANNDSWPSLDIKRDLTTSILREVSLLDDVVLAYSVLDDQGLEILREHRWRLVLVDVPEARLRERLARREAEQGWTNAEWLPFHLENISYLSELAVFDHVVDGGRDPGQVLESVRALVEHSGGGGGSA